MTLNRRSFVTLAAAAAPAISQAAKAASPAAVLSGNADDPLGVRGDFPLLNDRVFLNSAYIAPCPKQVVAAGQAYLESKCFQSPQLGPLMGKCNDVRAQFAKLVNATPEEIGLLYSTGEGENVVASGLELGPGDNVVIDELHYATEFILYRTLRKTKGVELRIAKHRNGVVEAKDFEPLVDKKTKLVSIALVSHLNGYRHDVKAIADVAHAKGAYLYADAIQALGTFPFDVRAADLDFMCAGSYKWLLSNFGIAPFYVRSSLGSRLKLDRYGEMSGGKQQADESYEYPNAARRFEFSSRAFGDAYILSAGLAYLEKVGVDRIEKHTIDGLAFHLQRELAKQGHKLFTPMGNRSPIVVFYTSKAPADVNAAFRAKNIEVTARQGTVRISPALFNNNADIEKCLEVTKTLV